MYIKTEIFINNNGVKMKRDYYGNMLENGEHEITTIVETENVDIVEPDVAQKLPTQLDRIEEMVSKTHAEIAQEARDAYTLELIEGGVIA